MSSIQIDGKKRYNNYTLSILFSTLIGVAVIIPALLMHALSLGSLPEWLIDFVYTVFGIAFVSRLVSGSSYVFSLLDRLTNEFTLLDFILPKSQKNQIKKTSEKTAKTAKIALLSKQIVVKTKSHLNAYRGQFVGNSLGFIFGTIFAVTTLILRAVSPTIINGVITSAFYLINHISNFSGLFNRLGRTTDYFHKDPKKGEPSKSRFCRKNVNYAMGVILGSIASAVLITVILFVAGVTSAMSLGGAVPIWLSLGLLVIGTISTGASAGGYVGRCIDFFIGKRTIAHAIADTVKNVPQVKTWRDRLNCEYGGTVIGVAIGITLAIVLIAAGVASLPFFGLGLPKLFAGMILLTACVSQCGGLGNRLGQMLDKFFDTRKPKKKMDLDIPLLSDISQTETPPASPAPASSCNTKTVYDTDKEQVAIPLEAAKCVQAIPDHKAVAASGICTDQYSVLVKTTMTNMSNYQALVTHKQDVKQEILIPAKKIQLKDITTFSAKDIAKMGIFGKTMAPRSSLPPIEIPELDKTHLHTFSAAAAA